MKKTFKTIIYSAVLGLGTLLSFSGQAQEQQTATETTLTPKFGIKGGLNLSNLYVDDVKDENMKVSGVGGFFAKLPLTKGISLMPELLYSSKGAKLTYDNVLQGQGEYRFNLNYVEVPLSLSFNIIKNFNIHAGGYASFLTSANVKNMNDNGDIVGITNLNADDFNRFDYGVLGGAGIDIGNMTIGARYNYGLREVGKPGTTAGDLTKNSKNSSLSIFLGFAF